MAHVFHRASQAWAHLMLDQSPSAPDLARFGVFELDFRSGELRKAGRRLNLQEQPLQVLTLLLNRPGEVVTRDELRQLLWPNGTFVDFEHGLNNVVNRLRDTLGDSAEMPRYIETLPRRGYRFIAMVTLSHPVRQISPAPAALAARIAAHRRLAGVALVATAIVLATTVIWLRSSLRELATAPPRVVPLTTLPGAEAWSTFSPDGNQVAFQWTGENIFSPYDIYVKIIGSPEVRRLTTDPADDVAPTWSPDGRYIAYVRFRPEDTPEGGRIHLVSPLGGSDVKLSDFPTYGSLAWSPDGRYLAAGREAGSHDQTGIFLVPTEGGDPRPLTPTTKPSFDLCPAFSPDGHRLAYASCTLHMRCDVYLLELNDAMKPFGSARRLTTQAFGHIPGLAWTRDGAWIIYTRMMTQNHTYLWRTAVEGNQPPERLEIAGLGAWLPATTRARDVLMFSRDPTNSDVYRFAAHHPPAHVLTSLFDESEPAFSPDGRRIAFSSARSGETMNIWVADADGSGARQITHGPSLWQGSPRWSPDGQHVVFESFDRDHWHIWMVDAEGGTARQITNASGDQNAPSWSHDGHWIYFSADGGTGRNVWRVNSAGGQPQRVTSGGSGFYALESADGRCLLYQALVGDGPLLIVPLAGGPARSLPPCVQNRVFESATSGLYYVPCNAVRDPPLRRLDLVTGMDTVLGTLEPNAAALAVSPDESTILYETAANQGGADLMLIENFK